MGLYIVANAEFGGTLDNETFGTDHDGFRVVEAKSHIQAARIVAEEYDTDYGLENGWGGITLEVAKIPQVKVFDAEKNELTLTERTNK